MLPVTPKAQAVPASRLHLRAETRLSCPARVRCVPGHRGLLQSEPSLT